MKKKKIFNDEYIVCENGTVEKTGGGLINFRINICVK